MLKFLVRSVASGVAVYVVAKMLDETKIGPTVVRLTSNAVNAAFVKLNEAVAAASQPQVQPQAPAPSQYPAPFGGVR